MTTWTKTLFYSMKYYFHAIKIMFKKAMSIIDCRDLNKINHTQKSRLVSALF